MRIRRIGIAVFLLFWLYPGTVWAEDTIPESALYAQSAVVMEAETGRIVYAKNAETKRAMASTTKLMTLLIALEEGDPESRVTISERAASQPEVHMDTQAGETYRLEDLLYAMMLQSYNDTAVAIAEHIAGSVEAFCEAMNERAAELGAVDTHFSTPNGLDAEDHYATAYDMALIMREVIQNEEALTILQTRSYMIPADEGHDRNISLVNKNPMLNVDSGTLGGKTGFTANAGLCLVNAVQQNDVTLITVVLGSGWPPNSGCRVSDTRRLLQYGYEQFYMKDFSFDGTDTKVRVAVHDGDVQTVGSSISGDFRYYIKDSDTLEMYYDLPYAIEAPVQAGDIIGEAVISVNQKTVASLPIVCNETVEETTWSYFVRQLLTIL